MAEQSDGFTVAVLAHLTGGFYFGGILRGVVRELAAVGGRVILVQTLDAGIDDHEAVAAPDFDTLIGLDHVDGYLAISTAVRPAYLHRLRAAGKPVVLVGQTVDGFPAPAVMPGNRSGVAQAVAHLVGHGHTRIGFAGNTEQPDMRERFAAYEESLLAHGLSVDPLLAYEASSNTEAGGEYAAAALLAATDPPTAIVAATDRIALGLMSVLQRSGWQLPRDLAVVGFDNVDKGVHFTPSLSTATQDFDALGTTAARLLLAILGGEPASNCRQELDSELICRGSCGCPASATGDAAFDRALIQSADAAAHEQLRRSEHLARSMREQYEVGQAILHIERSDPRSLDWLALSHVPVGCLGMTVDDGMLNVVGTFDGAGVLPDTGAWRGPVGHESFPPRRLIEAADAVAGLVVYVVPVKTRGVNWGSLAVVGPIDVLSLTGLETYNNWAALLAVAFEHQRLLHSVRRSEERFALAARAANDGLFDWDLASGALYLSPRARALFGYVGSTDVPTPAQWLDGVHPDDREKLVEGLRDRTRDGSWEMEHRVLAMDGTWSWMLTRALTVSADGIRGSRVVGSVSDITERKRLESELRRGALYDALTNLPNRSLFVDRVSWAMAQRGRRADLRFAVLFVDLDGFKAVNDSLGHLVGDVLLSQVATRLTSVLRATDTAARFGGDEYAVLLYDTPVEAVEAIVLRLQEVLAAPFVLNDLEVVVTASVGITTSDNIYVDPEEMLRDADIAMYTAKSTQRGSYAFFDGHMHQGALRRLQLQSALRHAFEAKEFEVLYQPIVDMDTSVTTSFEALIRWRHPERGLVPPVEFLGSLEETGLIVRLGRWIIDEVCSQISQWRETYPGRVTVSVNVSHREFWAEGLLEHILDCLARHRVPPACLTIEITEGVIMTKPEAARQLMQQMADAGLRLSVDDFGTGYSSLHALHSFPVQVLKIDRSFINGLDVESKTTELVHTIVSMARNLGLSVVAEGVETLDQHKHLQAIGCGNGQGYWFARPLTAADASAILGEVLPQLPQGTPPVIPSQEQPAAAPVPPR